MLVYVPGRFKIIRDIREKLSRRTRYRSCRGGARPCDCPAAAPVPGYSPYHRVQVRWAMPLIVAPNPIRAGTEIPQATP